MGRPKITLYCDTVSPFSYIAYYILRNDPIFLKCDITYVPILLGGVMKATGNTPPIQVKNKDKWIDVERIRWANYFSVPMVKKTPDGFPPLTLSIMRALCALTILEKESDQNNLCKAFDALFHAFWVESKPTNELSVLGEVLKKAVGEELTAKVLEMAPKEGKPLLLKNTDKALADGAFGLPWFTCTRDDKTEGFWGVDHLGQVADFLGLEKPKTGGWKAML